MIKLSLLKLNKVLITFFFLFFSFCSIPSFSQTNERVITQMNYCINSLTNIINATSVEELDHEIDHILNFLSMEQVAGMDEIHHFRNMLFTTATELQINQQEKNLLQQKQKLRRDQAKWNALSSGLNNAMMLIPGVGGNSFGPQLAFYGLLTAARSGVEFQNQSKQIDLDEMVELWALKKRDLESWKSLRSSAMDIVYNLYKQYHLKEFDRLTENSANLFNQISKESDPKKRLRLLLDNQQLLGNQLSYNYLLGISYYELGDYVKADKYFKAYEEKYNRLQLFRYDERSGLIALARLQALPNFPGYSKQSLIDIITYHLPQNGAANLACVISLLSDNKKIEAAQLLRKALDKNDISDRQALLLTASKLIPELKNNSIEKNNLLDIISNYRQTSFFLGATLDLYGKDGINWNYWNSILLFNKISYRPWFTLWLGHRQLHKKFEIALPGKTIRDDSLKIYRIEKRKDEIKLIQESYSYKYGILKSEIFKRIKIIKDHPELLPIFFTTIIEDSIYFVKNKIDYDALKNCNPSSLEFRELKTMLSVLLFECDDKSDNQIKKNVKENQKLVKELANFLKKHENKSPEFNLLVCQPIKSNKNTLYLESKIDKFQENKVKIKPLLVKNKPANNDIQFTKIITEIDQYIYSPIYSIIDEGDYILLEFNDYEKFSLIYKFDKKDGNLKIFGFTFRGTTYFESPQTYCWALQIPSKIQEKEEIKENSENKAEESGKWYDGILETGSSGWEWITNKSKAAWNWSISLFVKDSQDDKK